MNARRFALMGSRATAVKQSSLCQHKGTCADRPEAQALSTLVSQPVQKAPLIPYFMRGSLVVAPVKKT
jgi:hypothetical protein